MSAGDPVGPSELARRLGVRVDMGSELARGRTYVDRWRRTDWEPNAHVAVDIRADDFLDFLVELLNSLS